MKGPLEPETDGGNPPLIVLEAGAPDADADSDAEVDASSLRCSGAFCLVDLPNAAVYGLSDWFFTGVHVDPQIGAWAVANGGSGDEGATAQVLHFEGNAWKVVHTVKLDEGVDSRNVRLTALTGDGAGKLLAVGTIAGETTGVVLRSDGVTFTVETFEEDLRGAWFASPGRAWVVGNGGRIFHSAADGGWISESADGGDFGAVWGSTGGDDVFVAGSIFEEFDDFGHLGHRSIDDAGAKWSFTTFNSAQTQTIGWPEILAGVVAGPGSSWFSAPPNILARASFDGGEEGWTRDAFNPRIPLRGFWARSPVDLWAVGNVGRVYRFDGTSWVDSRLAFNGAPLIANLTKISGTTTGELFVVGEGVALHKAASQ